MSGMYVNLKTGNTGIIIEKLCNNGHGKMHERYIEVDTFNGDPKEDNIKVKLKIFVCRRCKEVYVDGGVKYE